MPKHELISSEYLSFAFAVPLIPFTVLGFMHSLSNDGLITFVSLLSLEFIRPL